MPVLQTGLATPSASSFEIEQSIRVDDGDSANLSRTPSSAGNRKTWTWSGWIKRGNLATGSNQCFFSAGVDGSNYQNLAFNTSDKLIFEHYESNVLKGARTSSAVYRDPSAWMHCVVAYDTTQSTASDRIKIYVNGELLTDFSSTTDPAQDHDGIVNNTVEHRHFSIGYGAYWLFDGLIAEAHFVDGTALTPASFGETSSSHGQWVPKDTTGAITYGTNGFYLKGADSALANSFTDNSSSSKTITANGDVAHSRAQAKIGSSSIKFDGTGDFLSCADSSDWSFGTGDFTLETWVRFNDSAGSENLFSQYQDGSNRWYLSADLTNNSLGFYDAGSGMDVEQTVVTWVADTWYHVAMVRSSGTVTYYVDGTAYTISGTSPGGNITNNTGTLQIGQYNTGDNLNGYLDRIRISNSARYTSAFTPSTTAFASDSNTKLLIQSDFSGGLGADSSGNKNDLTSANLTANDVVLDAPGRNFATLNPLDGFNSMTATEGNLRAHTNSGSNPKINATFQIPQSGKWYWEFVDQHGLSIMIGVVDQINTGSVYSNNNSVIYNSGDGNKYNFSSSASYGASWTTGDIIGVAFNRDDNEITFYKNNASQGTLTIGGTAAQRARLMPMIGTGTTGTGGGTFNFGQDSSFANTKSGSASAQDANGKGDFFYAPPANHLALCSDNLSNPSIADPTAHFDTKLYTGTGAELAVTGLNFSPGLTWIKTRALTYNHRVFDVVRGVTKELYPNTTGAEVTDDAQTLKSFDSNGFTLGTSSGVNPSSTMASWNWKAGGTASSNTDGTITSSVSANPTAGFSVLTYTGNNTAGATIGHGLGSVPELIITKGRTASASAHSDDWFVYLEKKGANAALKLNSDATPVTSATQYWNNTSPTSSVFSVSNDTVTNENSRSYVAYCFSSVEGYSKVGSYVGNDQNPNGPFIYMGFKPAFLMIKALDRSDDWIIVDNKRDSYNIVTRKLNPNTAGAEITNHAIVDFVSNGFKIKDNSDKVNLLNSNYLYLAFAESPFKYSNAR